jgi:hypothetical protein
VLSLCKEAGLVKVGLIAIDGTKVHANASHHCNLDYEQLAREILKEAEALDAAEDELYGDARGDELPEQLQTREGRRAALREAKQRLERDRGENEGVKSEAAARAGSSGVKIELDAGVILARVQGRDGWLLEARRQLDEHRRRKAMPIERSRAGGCWRQSDGPSRTSRSSAKPTRHMSTTGRMGATRKADDSVAHQSHTSRPRYLRGRSTRLILIRGT